jgi:hypothetical protein
MSQIAAKDRTQEAVGLGAATKTPESFFEFERSPRKFTRKDIFDHKRGKMHKVIEFSFRIPLKQFCFCFTTSRLSGTPSLTRHFIPLVELVHCVTSPSRHGLHLGFFLIIPLYFIVYLFIFNYLTPKVLGVFFIKTASKQPLFKAR